MPKPALHRIPAASPEAEPAPPPDPDLVDRIFEYLTDEQLLAVPVPCRLRDLKAALRAEFAGEECYIAIRPASVRREIVADVLRLFDGRNAREVARRLGIGRMTVYRIVKQAGGRGAS